MTCDEWNKFIQVNIYGHTLQGLQQQGVALEAVLCFVRIFRTISAVQNYGLWKDQCTKENHLIIPLLSPESDITVPVLSTTFADVKCPRFSTPAVSQNDLQRKFTLNLPVKLSEINSSFEDDGLLDDREENDGVVVQLLSELVEKATEEFKESFVPANPLFSTTIVKTDLHRFSTPIVPDFNSGAHFTLNMPDILSEIESSDEDEPFLEEPAQFCAPILRSRTKSMLPAPPQSQKTCRKRNSANPKLAHTSTTAPKQRKVLKKSASMVLNSNKVELKQKKVSVIPVIKTENSEEFPSMTEFLSASEATYTSANTAPNNSPPPQTLVRELSELVYHDMQVMENDGDMESWPVEPNYPEVDFDDFGEAREEDTVLIDHQEEIGRLEEESDEETEQKDPPANQATIKKVSFAEPLIQSAKKAEMNKIQIVKCHFKVTFYLKALKSQYCFQDCKKSYTWRKKYGKARLVDHAISHVPDLLMKCDLCDYTCKGIRQIRYHHKRSHPDVPFQRLGIKRVMSTSEKDTDFAKVWDMCYKKNIAFAENGGMSPFARNDKGISRRVAAQRNKTTQNPDDEEEEKEEAQF
ncbi:Protein CBR-ZIM-1 [Caenorhabditis briggsae]|uniref:Protein CBR-ZIM-1 n=1 Tax=Caenorhabditis briggsae TaxID=6238 RepID=A8XGL9_CAEBR|nr:Protein CBR-ZIM-1 [Caenorhabditis briggsae]CAP31793.2 Protein CBR-ZIM-1 [Caenorhabditis briggsae]